MVCAPRYCNRVWCVKLLAVAQVCDYQITNGSMTSCVLQYIFISPSTSSFIVVAIDAAANLSCQVICVKFKTSIEQKQQ